MLFCCCFNKKQALDESQTNGLKEELINKQKKLQAEITVSKIQMEKQSVPQVVQPIKQPVFINQNLQKMKVMESCSQFKVQVDLNQVQENEPKNVTRSLHKIMSNDETQKIKKQSDLRFESGNKILYYVNQKDQEMVFLYKVIKRKEQTHLINYILQPHRYSNKIRSKPIDLTLCLFLSTQTLPKLKTMISGMITDHHIKAVFGLFGVFQKQQEQKKTNKNLYETEYVQDIIIVGNNCLRLEPFERIIISLSAQKDFKSILSHCQRITQHFQMEEMARVSFIFPSFITLSQINTILSKLTRKFLISQKLQKSIKHLGYLIELFEDDNFEEVIIVSCNQVIFKAQQKSNKEFELKLQLAIGLLMIEVDYNNVKLFETLISSFLMDKTISEYLKFIQYLHKEKRDFVNKLQQLKLFDSLQLQEIQKSRKVQQKQLGNNQRSITIKHRNKKKLGELFREYQTTKTPIEQSQKKKEWDDDLKENDIRATIMQKQSKKVQSNCNIFEVIDDSFVEKTNLDLLPNMIEMEFQEDD